MSISFLRTHIATQIQRQFPFATGQNVSIQLIWNNFIRVISSLVRRQTICITLYRYYLWLEDVMPQNIKMEYIVIGIKWLLWQIPIQYGVFLCVEKQTEEIISPSCSKDRTVSEVEWWYDFEIVQMNKQICIITGMIL